MFSVSEATDKQDWEAFIATQQFRPFLQSWTMGEVYRQVGHDPIRLKVEQSGTTVGVCQAITVPARRGRHLAVSYGPLLADQSAWPDLITALEQAAKEQDCSFLRLSPFLPAGTPIPARTVSAPLHLLAEHIWYLPLRTEDPWQKAFAIGEPRTEEDIMANMRKNTRNLIRRAGREGVTIERSTNPTADLSHFLKLHEETRKRHQFTPYTDDFFRAQVELFSAEDNCTLYLARYQDEVIASSVHMHMYGETSYHHGASTHKYPKVPASYLLQWTAIMDALERDDHVYSFWGIAPQGAKNHPFQGVTTFKTGYGGNLLELMHCVDVPLSARYHATRAFEWIRKIKRGF